MEQYLEEHEYDLVNMWLSKEQLMEKALDAWCDSLDEFLGAVTSLFEFTENFNGEMLEISALCVLSKSLVQCTVHHALWQVLQLV